MTPLPSVLKSGGRSLSVLAYAAVSPETGGRSTFSRILRADDESRSCRSEPFPRPIFVPSRGRRAWPLLLLLLGVSIYFGTAIRPPLFDDVDAAHALAAREMLHGGDKFVLHINGIRYLEKAPLHYWLVAASYSLLGVNEFATRLPTALSMVGLVLLLFYFGRDFFGQRAGLYAGLVACTSLGMFIYTRTMIPEPLCALEFALFFYLFLRGWTGSLSPALAYRSCAVLLAFAVLTRGLVGLVIPLGGLACFLLLTGGWKRWREFPWGSCSLIFLAVAVPWHIVAGLRAPRFFWFYFVNEQLLRALGAHYPQDTLPLPLLFWWGAHLIWFFPWIFFIPCAFRGFPRLSTWRGGLDAAGQARLLLFSWAVTVLAFFSLTRTRSEYYSFGAWPAIALLIGEGIARAEEQEDSWLPRIHAALAGMGILITAGLGAWFLTPAATSAEGNLSQIVLLNGVPWYRLKIAESFVALTKPIAGLRGPALAASLSLLLGLWAAYWFRRRSRSARGGYKATLAIGAAMAGLLFSAGWALEPLEPYLSSRLLARSVLRQLRPEDLVATYGDFYLGSSFAFYLDRRMFLYNGRRNSLEFGASYPDAPRIFFTDYDFSSLWRGPRRVFLFVPADLRREVLPRLPPGTTYLLSESGGKAVYVNQPLWHGQVPLCSSPVHPGRCSSG